MLNGFLSILLNVLVFANLLAVLIYLCIRRSGGGGWNRGRDYSPPEPCPRPPGRSMKPPLIRQMPLNGEQDPVLAKVDARFSEEVLEVM